MNPVITIAAVAVLCAITLTIVLALGLEHPRLQPWAIARALIQLAVLSVVLNGVISDGRWVALFLLVMVGAATLVTSDRMRLSFRQVPRVGATILLGSALPVIVVFASGAVELSPRYVLAVGGIVIGNTMTVSTLMGRSLSMGFLAQRDELEAWLSLGATPRRAALRAVRSAASTALIPSTDQTKSTGLVTLPGAFVGAVFAGASPIEAAQFQLVVLAAILTAGALTVASFTWVFGAPKTLPLDDRPLGGRPARSR